MENGKNSKENKSMAAKFAEFDQRHPEVWLLFKDFTFEMIGTGRKHYSADAIMHRVRWETDIAVRPGDEKDQYKINNNHIAFYARKFNKAYPQHEGFFRMRISEADMNAEENKLE